MKFFFKECFILSPLVTISPTPFRAAILEARLGVGGSLAGAFLLSTTGPQDLPCGEGMTRVMTSLLAGLSTFEQL